MTKVFTILLNIGNIFTAPVADFISVSCIIVKYTIMSYFVY